MRYQPTDILPRTARQDPGEGRLGEFDCELPEEARRELGKPKRARILRPPDPPKKRSWFDIVRSWGNVAVLGLCGLFFVVALCSVVSWFANKHESRPVPAPAIVQPTPATVQPAPSVQNQPTSQVAPIQPAPRAGLVRLPLPPPRAQLVRLPASDNAEIAPQNIGRTHTMAMPYGTVVNATLRGFLGNETQLPRAGQIGDMYLVEQTPWIWIQVPGTTAPTWVDP